MSESTIEVHDIVRIHNNALTWEVKKITDRIEPLGVTLISGLTERTRYESYENLRLVKKGGEA